MMLKRSKDRKVTNKVTPSGNVSIANTFGLPAGKDYSCPNATAFCESICYAGKLEKLYKGVKAQLLHNWNLLKDASPAEMIRLLDDMIYDFERECDKRNAEKLFRIHWDGDFFNMDYMVAWGVVIKWHPKTRFWVYTRVPLAAEFLSNQNFPNLSLYFSADPDNIQDVPEGVNVAYVDRTFAEGKAAIPNATKCPENNKALPLISEKGSACVVCGLCINQRRNVLFSTSKK